MNDPLNLTVLTWVLAAGLGVLGAAKLVGAPWFAALYNRLDYPWAYRPVTGLLQIAAAALLCVPQYRLAGIAIAAAISFLSVVGMLEHREYRWAAAGVGLLTALWAQAVFGAL